MKKSFPLVPFGSLPNCFSCSAHTDPNTLSKSGYPEGQGSKSVKCPVCGLVTFFDFSPAKRNEKEIDVFVVEITSQTNEVSANEACVIAFGSGGYLGQARTVVESLGSAILYTRAEALEKAKVYEVGTYSIIPLRKFDLDCLRDQAARESEAGL